MSAFGNLSMDVNRPHPRQPRCPQCRVAVVTDMLLGRAGEHDSFHLPTPGDWSVCAHCATILRFYEDMDGTLQLRRATQAEQAEIEPDDPVLAAVGAVRMAIEMREERER